MPIRVNDKLIPDTAIDQEVARLEMEQRQQQRQQPPNDQMPPAMRREILRKQAREHVVGRELLAQEAAKRFAQVPGNVVDEVYRQQFEKADKKKPAQAVIDQRRAGIKRSLRVRRLLDELAQGIEAPTEEEVFNLYMRERQAFSRPEAVHASHIVKHVNKPEDEEPAKAAIEKAHAELEAGADFAELAARMSDCSDRSGDLGTFPRGQMVESFEDIVFHLDPGSYSQVFKTEFGYHVAFLHEHFPAQITPIEEVRDQLVEHLSRQRHIDKIEELIVQLKQDATVADE